MSDEQENPALQFTGVGVYQRKDDARTEYAAFSEDRTASKRPLQALEIRMKDYRTEIIFYGYVMRISCTAADALIIKTTDCMVYIGGKHLDKLISLLKRKKAEYIQEFDASQFQRPDPGQPIIETIKVAELFSSNKVDDSRAA